MSESNKVAEMSVIGCIIVKPDIIPDVIETSLTPEMFGYSVAKVVYEAILDLFSGGKTPDFVMVLRKVASSYPKSDHDFKNFILRCVEMVPAPSRAKDYAEMVINGYKTRKLQNIGINLADKVVSEDADELANSAMTQIYELMSLKNKKNIENIGDISKRVIKDYKSNEKNSENRSHTGFKKLDSILKGMSAGNLIVLAARPKVGKTAFSLAIAKNVAKLGKTVLFYSLEMEKAEIYERLISNMAGIPMNSIIDRKFNEDNRISRLESTSIEALKCLPLEISDSPSISVNDIRSQCRLFKNLGLIVIDYLQLMKPTKKHDNRNQEIGSISRELKMLASEIGVPILCLAQLNRTSTEEKRPTPSDLRDSGEIEQNCSKLMLMWCVEKHFSDLGSIISKTVGVDVALNRRGSSGVVLMDFNGDYMCFKELEKKYEEPKNYKWK